MVKASRTRGAGNRSPTPSSKRPAPIVRPVRTRRLTQLGLGWGKGRRVITDVRWACLAIGFLAFTIVNRLNWWLVRCAWSYPYGRSARQRARSERA